MATISPLAEYLLAYTTPTGQKLAKFGAALYSTNLLPPNQPVNIAFSPLWGYANIYFFHRFSPSIVPNTIFWTLIHRGIIMNSTFINSTLTASDLPCLIEVTERDPIFMRVINLSTVNQFFEGLNGFLVISSPTELAELQKVIRRYGGTV